MAFVKVLNFMPDFLELLAVERERSLWGLKEGLDEEFLDERGHHCLSGRVKAAGNI